jgi:hypothetical protein
LVLELALAGRASEKIPRLARLGLFFSWSEVEAGVFYDVVLSAVGLGVWRAHRRHWRGSELWRKGWQFHGRSCSVKRRIDPTFEQIRDHARFQELAAGKMP